MQVSEMKSGEVRYIRDLKNDEISLRLIEMGCLPGSPLTYNFAAPLGDPICISVEGYDLSLRIEEADSILVE